MTVAVDPITGRAPEWLRLTLREDAGSQTWDLWVDGRLAAAAVGFQEPIGSQPGSYVILGDALERLVLDDLVIGGPHPLGLDSDGDGMLDSEELAIGSNPAVADRTALDGQGKPFQDKWVEMHSGQPPVSVPPPAAPVFSHAPAVAREAFPLTLSSPGAATIYYTLDGSDPVPPAALTYSGPVTITTTTVVRAGAADAQGRLSKFAAAGYVFAADVPVQEKPAAWPDTLEEVGSVTGGIQHFPLGVGLGFGEVDGGPLPRKEQIVEALRNAPILMLALPPDQLFGPVGIYSQSSQSGMKAGGEVIWMNAGASASGGAGTASFSISGQSSRSHAVTVKHSIRVSLPEAADAGLVFGAEAFPVSQFLLRHPTQDSWAVSGNGESLRRGARYVADAWASQWLAEAGHSSLKHHWVHVFLNGTYWGVYDAVEQHDTEYAARHPEAGEERRLLEPAPLAGRGSVKSILGSTQEWHLLMARLEHLAAGGERTTGEAWQGAASHLDVPGLIDYVLWNWWLQTAEWPVKNWLVSWEERKWKFISWDAERAMPDVPAASMADRFVTDRAGPGAVFRALCQWSTFRASVAARFNILSAAEGALHPTSLGAGLDRAAAKFNLLVHAESARWGGAYAEPRATAADWAGVLATLKAGYVQERTTDMGRELTAWLGSQEVAAKRNPGPGQSSNSNNQPTSTGGGLPFADWALLDSDGDGIPDHWERLMGLDPANDQDAVEDQDRDGITNLEEYLRRGQGRVDGAVPLLDFNSPGLHNRFSIPTRRRILPAMR